MNPLAADWSITPRSENCSATGRPFAPGESFYTLLYREGDGFRREDVSEDAWGARNENIRPFSFWRSKYEPEPPPSPEPLGQETVEELFRRLQEEANAPAHACFVLAVMLERKRLLKQVRTEEVEGRRVLIYEHVKTGDVFVVTDPDLRLTNLEQVQQEVLHLLRPAPALA